MDSSNADLSALKMACKLSSVGSNLELISLEEMEKELRKISKGLFKSKRSRSNFQFLKGDFGTKKGDGGMGLGPYRPSWSANVDKL
ncbi:hypothetical protein QYF36_003048 [Acer negundo]|nr:hypothetical protein QYF36_003048 [Acer negundo]